MSSGRSMRQRDALPSFKRAQRLQHVGVITERQRRMQSADDVQFRDAELQRLARLLDNFLDGKLEAVGVAFLARERAELAGQDAVIRVVDVAVDDVAGAVADLFSAARNPRWRRRRSNPWIQTTAARRPRKCVRRRRPCRKGRATRCVERKNSFLRGRRCESADSFMLWSRHAGRLQG